MSKEREIFEQAIEIASEQARQEFLRQACGNDESLRRSVEELLSQYAVTGEFILDRPLDFGQPPAPQPEISVGSVIGPYRLMEQIGQGGMGVVFIAEQRTPVVRRVALKVIKPGMDSKEVINRFNAERQALAMMDHPNIAKVLDAGQTPEGRPFFVMELVRGVPITLFCDERRLPGKERLRLFIDVCNAIQHAHQKGIIHRDIKPSNVLVTLHDSRPVAKVIDFGVAKAINQRLAEGTVYTNFTQLIGTPMYMSPEQAEMSGLDIDTRSDIYSLGVLLYELMTGETPFEKQRMRQAAVDEMRRIIREEEPLRPSLRISSLGENATTVSQQRGTDPRQLKQWLQGDIDWIVMQALEKERSRRYETANAFAADVARYLEQQPVLARPPNSMYRFRKFLQRNKGGVIAAGLLLASLVLGIVGTSIGLAWALDQRKLAHHRAIAAQASAAEAAAAQDVAEREARNAQEAVQRMLSAVGDVRLRHVPLMDGLRTQLLQDALEFNQRFLDTSDARDVRLEAGRAYQRVADIYALLEQQDAALAALQEGREISRQILSEDPQAQEAAFQLAEIDQHIAQIQMRLERNELAEASLRSALDQYERQSQDASGQQRHLTGTAASWRLLGQLYELRSAQAEAEQAFRDALQYLDRLALDSNGHRFAQLEKAATLTALANLLTKTKRPHEAEPMFEDALNIHLELVEAAPQNRDYLEALASGYLDQAAFFMSRGQHQESRAAFENAQQCQQRLVGNFPQIPDYRAALANTIGGLAINFAHEGKLTDAEREFANSEKAFADLCRDFPDVPEFQMEHAGSARRYGVLLSNSERFEEAQQKFKLARALIEPLAESNPDDTGYQQQLSVLGHLIAITLYRNDKEDPEVDVWLQGAIQINERLATQFPEETGIRHKLGQYYRLMGQVQENRLDVAAAEAEYRNSIRVHRQLVEDVPDFIEYHRHLAINLRELGELLSDNGRWSEAEELLREAVAISERNRRINPERQDHAVEAGMYRNTLGWALAGAEDYSGATFEFQQAAAIYQLLLASDPAEVRVRGEYAYSIRNQAALLRDQGLYSEASNLYESALAEIKQQLRDMPGMPTAVERGRTLVADWFDCLLKAGRADSLETALAELPALTPGDWQGELEAAGTAARAIPTLSAEANLPAETKQQFEQQLQQLAVKHLALAIDQGMSTRDELQQRDSFNSLQALPEFQVLLEQLHD